MEEALLAYGPAILAVALALILRHRQAKKKANELREPHIAVKSAESTMNRPPQEGVRTLGREILERFWEEDR